MGEPKRKRRRIWLLVIVLFLVGFAVAAWWGVNWLIAGQLDIIYYTKSSDAETLRYIMRYRPDMAQKQDRYKLMPLHLAVERGDVDSVVALLEGGAPVNAECARWKFTPLHYVARQIRYPTLRNEDFFGRSGRQKYALMTEDGARVPERPDDHMRIARLLLDAGADPRARSSRDGRTPLHIAAMGSDIPLSYGDTAMVRLFLDEGAGPNAIDNDGKTSLHYAAMHRADIAMAMLIKDGANVNAASLDGITPIQYLLAGERNSYVWYGTHAVNCLGQLIKAGAKIVPGRAPVLNEKPNASWSPLAIAAAQELRPRLQNVYSTTDPYPIDAQGPVKEAIAYQLKMVRMLIAAGGDPNVWDRHPLRMAAKRDDPAMVKLLLDLGASAKPTGSTRYGMPPLHHAARNLSIEITQLLLKAGADPNELCNTPETESPVRVLDMALKDNHSYGDHPYYEERSEDQSVSRFRICAMLIDVGAQVKISMPQKRFLLYEAARANRPDIIRKVLSAEVKEQSDDEQQYHLRSNNGYQPLHVAAREGNLETVRLLLKSGEDPNAKTKRDWTPPLYALRYDYPEIAKALLDAGAKVGGHTYRRDTCLHFVNYQRTDVVRRLLAAGAQANVVNCMGTTPLHNAARSGNAEAVRLLLAKGAKAEAFDMDGNTPLGDALHFGHRECAALLRKHGARLVRRQEPKESLPALPAIVRKAGVRPGFKAVALQEKDSRFGGIQPAPRGAAFAWKRWCEKVQPPKLRPDPPRHIWLKGPLPKPEPVRDSHFDHLAYITVPPICVSKMPFAKFISYLHDLTASDRRSWNYVLSQPYARRTFALRNDDDPEIEIMDGKRLLYSCFANLTVSLDTPRTSLTTLLPALIQKAGLKIRYDEEAVVIADPHSELREPVVPDYVHEESQYDDRSAGGWATWASKHIVVTATSFEGTSLSTAISFLMTSRSREVELDGPGVQENCSSQLPTDLPAVHLSLYNLTLFDVIRYMSFAVDTPVRFDNDTFHFGVSQQPRPSVPVPGDRKEYQRSCFEQTPLALVVNFINRMLKHREQPQRVYLCVGKFGQESMAVTHDFSQPIPKLIEVVCDDLGLQYECRENAIIIHDGTVDLSKLKLPDEPPTYQPNVHRASAFEDELLDEDDDDDDDNTVIDLGDDDDDNDDELEEQIYLRPRICRPTRRFPKTQGDPEATLKSLAAVVAASPKDPLVVNRAACMLETMGELETAAELLRRTIQLSPKEPGAYCDLGRILGELGQHEKAVKILFGVGTRPWAKHYDGFQMFALEEMNRLIAKAGKSFDVDKQFIRPVTADLRVVLQWFDDDAALGLIVAEPSKREVYGAFHRVAGGMLHNTASLANQDEYRVANAQAGTYKIEAMVGKDYLKDRKHPIRVLVRIYKNYGRANEEQKVITTLLKPGKKKAIAVVELPEK